jgi:hypothetical protein
MAELVTLVSRRRAQDPPAWVVFESLVDPLNPNARRSWFDVRPGEVPPKILEQRRPDRVVWSSIWADHPDLVIEFDIDGGDRAGCIVTWRLLGRDAELDDQDVRDLRYRLNQLINGQLRDTFDQ